jgi:outer membrane protein TolC
MVGMDWPRSFWIVTPLLIGALGCASAPHNPVSSSKAENPNARDHLASSARLGEDRSSRATSQKIASKSTPTLDDDAVIRIVSDETEILDSEDALPASNVVAAEEIPSAAEESEVASSGDQKAPAVYSLTLSNVIGLADARNPNVILARERINEAYARVDRAEALWLPSLRAGINYNHHEGAIQDVAGTVFNTTRSSLYGGFGANAVGAGSPAVPGLVAQFHLTDAIFQPRAATHLAAARQYGASAVRNDILRDTAVAYLELVRAERTLAIAMEALDNTQKLTDLTREYAEAGEGLQSDHQRMEAELSVRQDRMIAAQEGVLVASSRLAQLLHANPACQIVSGEPAVVPLSLMTLDRGPAEFVSLGLCHRPELAEHQHLVCEAVERMKRERFAPLIPSVLLGVSYGGLGGSIGSSISNTDDRLDADAVAYWEIRNLGLGERAARNETSSVVRQAQWRQIALLDRVASEIAEAHSQVALRERRVEIARAAIQPAERSYDLNQQRIQNKQGLPIEVLQAIQALASARQTYLNAVVDYNVSQFQLCRATGWFETPP